MGACPISSLIASGSAVILFFAPSPLAGWEQAAAGFPEIPKGRNPYKIWYNPAIVRCGP